MTTKQLPKSFIGTVSEATMREEDLIPAFGNMRTCKIYVPKMTIFGCWFDTCLGIMRQGK
jgi:hypothetical protein